MHERTVRRREEMRAKARVLKLYVREYGTDEGPVQARVFTNPKSDFFSGDHIFHSPNKGIRTLMAFLDGYRAGKESEGWRKK